MGLAIRRMLHFVSNDVDIGVAKERGKDGECASQATRSETTRFSWLINLHGPCSSLNMDMTAHIQSAKEADRTASHTVSHLFSF